MLVYLLFVSGAGNVSFSAPPPRTVLGTQQILKNSCSVTIKAKQQKEMKIYMYGIFMYQSLLSELCDALSRSTS